jgi:hypothetical protein
MAKDKDKNPLNNLERMGGGGAGSAGGTTKFFGRKVPTSQIRLEMSPVPTKVATGPNKGQMQFGSRYGLVGKEKLSLFDRAKAVFNRNK